VYACIVFDESVPRDTGFSRRLRVHAATGSPVMIGIVRPRTGQRDLRRGAHHTGLLLRDLPDLVRHFRRQNDAGGAAGEVDHE
jgi:hypothetical protein